MQNKNTKIPVVISIIILFLAILPMPYGYYTLLRLVVCGIAIYLTWFAKVINRQGWMWVMGFIALLFNPLMPIHLDKATWSLIDLVVAVVFIVALFKIKIHKKEDYMTEITKEKALEIVKRHNARKEFKSFSITDSLPSNCHIYNAPENCWYILTANEELLALSSSRLVCICKSTGKILYDGSAGDEG